MRLRRVLPAFFLGGCLAIQPALGAVPAAFSGCVGSAGEAKRLLETEVRPVVAGGTELPEALSGQLQALRARFGECAAIEADSPLQEEFLQLYRTLSRLTEALRFASLTDSPQAQEMVQQAYQGALQTSAELAAVR